MSSIRFSRIDSPVDAIEPKVRMDGIRRRALETGRNRLLVTGVVFALAFSAIAGRLVELTVFGDGEPRVARALPSGDATQGRADVLDRNGVILATTLPTVSLYGDPREVLDVDEAAAKLAKVLPGRTTKGLRAKLAGPGRFVWLHRHLTPEQQYEVNRLGLPGIAFQRDERRIYPQGRAAAHVLGITDTDGNGIAGVESRFDTELRQGGSPLRLSMDVRVQSVLHRELSTAMAEFHAIGAAGVVMDAGTGEIVAMVSLPDFDPNVPKQARGNRGFNRVTKGVYEMGSIFKLFTTAMALDTGTVTLRSGYDAREPIKVARFLIRDFHAEKRWLSIPEILAHSSNIGAAKMAVDVGTEAQKDYLGRFGLLDASLVELPEVGRPLKPERWREINTMTISYGHGIAVSPLQVAEAVATVVNGGIRHPATLLRRGDAETPKGKRVLAEETSRKMRRLMRLVVEKGTGKNADAAGYRVGGKTGTAEKSHGGRYRRRALISSFVGAFPMDDPRYVVLSVLDEPKGNERTLQYATGGWTAAPMVGRMVERMASMLGIVPVVSKGDKSGDQGRQLVSLTQEGQSGALH